MARLGAVIVLIDGAGGGLRPVARAVRSRRRRSWRFGSQGRPARTGSASTSWGATSSRACSRAPASRCSSGSSSSASRPRSASLLGSIAGYFGGRVDEAISRVVDILLAFPGLLLAIALVAVLGPSLTNVVLALSLIGWVGYARLVRGQVLRTRELEFVQAARALGATTPRILARHVIPTDAAGGDRAGHARDGRRDSGGSGAQLPRVSACSRRRRAGERCSATGEDTCSTRRT